MMDQKDDDRLNDTKIRELILNKKRPAIPDDVPEGFKKLIQKT